MRSIGVRSKRTIQTSSERRRYRQSNWHVPDFEAFRKYAYRHPSTFHAMDSFSSIPCRTFVALARYNYDQLWGVFT
jgi:hypothetical protein